MDKAMRDCKSCRDHLSEYLDGTLGRRRAAGVRAHLLTCAACHTEFEDLQQLLKALKASTMPAPRPDFWPHTWNLLHARLAITPDAGRSPYRIFGPGSLAIAGGLILLALSLPLYRLSHRAPQTQHLLAGNPMPSASVNRHTRSQTRTFKKRTGGTLRRNAPPICVDALIALHVEESAGDPLSDAGRLHYLNAESEQADLKFDGKLDIR